MSTKKLWTYPLVFGVFGALIGLIIRYAYIGSIPSFSFKNFLHAHSHVMLLGFIFNGLLILVWDNFLTKIDKNSFRYFIGLQLCMTAMMVAFMIQGYAFYSILFSTLHVWLSYIILIRLWKRLKGIKEWNLLIKVGIIFQFISSIGPYALGPLMVLGLKESPWYQQAIFFYLHFQFFGIFFIWLIGILLKKANLKTNKKQIMGLALGIVLTYAHSLDYSFNHWFIHLLGGLGSVLLFVSLLSFKNSFQNILKRFKFIYYFLIIITLANIAGSFPQIGSLVVESRFMLIAWLHLLFLGLYVPFIWICLNPKIHKFIWYVYGISFILTEAILVFPNFISNWFSLSVLWLLFISYAGVAFSICFVHLFYLIESRKHKVILN